MIDKRFKICCIYLQRIYNHTNRLFFDQVNLEMSMDNKVFIVKLNVMNILERMFKK